MAEIYNKKTDIKMMSVFLLLRFIDLFQCFFELECKEHCSKGNCQKVRDRFSHIHSHCLVRGHDPWQDIDQWDQEDKFPHDSH